MPFPVGCVSCFSRELSSDGDDDDDNGNTNNNNKDNRRFVGLSLK